MWQQSPALELLCLCSVGGFFAHDPKERNLPALLVLAPWNDQ